ncbi:hypothetical protein C8J56DRAFT_1024212 [Mycena floridula]|nr:hypothetical protein C8J56DRAFT_1024212 [Mycena floridula]
MAVSEPYRSVRAAIKPVDGRRTGDWTGSPVFTRRLYGRISNTASDKVTDLLFLTCAAPVQHCYWRYEQIGDSRMIWLLILATGKETRDDGRIGIVQKIQQQYHS